jgi:hypothetical protein
MKAGKIDSYGWRHRERLMRRAAMRHFKQPFRQFGRETLGKLGKMDAKVHVSDAMRCGTLLRGMTLLAKA